MSTVSVSVARELVRSACYAPSVGNRQPWSWRLAGPSEVDLFADRAQQLVATDPEGRDVALSCGAALHHLVVAARGFGLDPTVDLVPDSLDSDLLARVTLSPGRLTDEAADLLAAMENRRIGETTFARWEVPRTRLQRLSADASAWGAHVYVLDSPQELSRTEAVLSRARSRRSEVDGHDRQPWSEPESDAPAPGPRAIPAQRDPSAPRFTTWAAPPALDSRVREEGRPDPSLAVFTDADDTRAWLRSGMALSAAWIGATQQGLTVVPETRVVEEVGARDGLRELAFYDFGRLQAVLRIGWPATTQSRRPRAARRPLDEVLDD